jgi:hypothetical protein
MEHGESLIRCAPELARRRKWHIYMLHPNAEEGGVRSCEAAKGQPGMGQIGHSIARSWQCGNGRPKEIEGPRAQGHYKPLL